MVVRSLAAPVCMPHILGQNTRHKAFMHETSQLTEILWWSSTETTLIKLRDWRGFSPHTLIYCGCQSKISIAMAALICWKKIRDDLNPPTRKSHVGPTQTKLCANLHFLASGCFQQVKQDFHKLPWDFMSCPTNKNKKETTFLLSSCFP